MNTNEIESAIEHAISALSLAKLALSKSALPMFNEGNVLLKADHGARKPPLGDAAAKALAGLEDINRRLDRLAAAADLDAQTRKTWSITQ